MVSNKMVETLTYANKCALSVNWEKITQQIVNAAWTEFNPDDESTWPKTHLAPSGRGWFREEGSGGFSFKGWITAFPWKTTVRYADPQDLMFNKGE